MQCLDLRIVTLKPEAGSFYRSIEPDCKLQKLKAQSSPQDATQPGGSGFSSSGKASSGFQPEKPLRLPDGIFLPGASAGASLPPCGNPPHGVAIGWHAFACQPRMYVPLGEL
jgi:hypothetical protein